MAFKMKNPSIAKLVKQAGNNRNDKNPSVPPKNPEGVRRDAPRTTYRRPINYSGPRPPQDKNKSIIQQAPSQFQQDLQKLARKTFDANPVVRGVKVIKKLGKKTGLTKDIKKKARKVKNYFGFYN